MVLMFGQRRLRGSRQDECGDLFEALSQVAAGKVKPIVETYPLAKANEVRAPAGRQSPLPRRA
jgi:D-arabinose 1-dehydrogenase-like Zn-dependent alcohol dehydrogenase